MMLRYGLKGLALLDGWLKHESQPVNGITFLIYHKVGCDLSLELELPFPIFLRQLTWLAQTKKVISYEQALHHLQQQTVFEESVYVLTFDDGYRDFYTHVWPLLRELNLPAILFVTTGFVDGIVTPLDNPYPVQAVNWKMLAELQESSLITLGAHTHTHPDLTKVTKEQLHWELSHPLSLFQKHLNFQPIHFAYPLARWNDSLEKVVKRYYHSSVIGSGKTAIASNFNYFQIPRLPIRASDGWFFFRLKIAHRLQQEEFYYNRLHEITKPFSFILNKK